MDRCAPASPPRSRICPTARSGPLRCRDIPDFAVNDRVTHDRHGLGSVVRITGDRIHVKFGENTVSVAMSSSKIHPL